MTLNIVPTRQSLILAGEPGGARADRSSLLGRASRLIASGGTLQRMTILASDPDSAVIVQAEFYDSPSSTALVAAGTTSLNRPATMSSHRDPIQLYLRTQRSLHDTRKAPLLDVLA